MLLTTNGGKAINKIGGVLCGINALIMLALFCQLIWLNQYCSAISNLAMACTLLSIVFFIIFVIDSIWCFGYCQDDNIIGIFYCSGLYPLTHLIIALHGFAMGLLIWFGFSDVIIPNYGVVSSDVLLKEADYLKTLAIVYIATAAIAGLICIAEKTSSDEYKQKMSDKNDRRIENKDKKAEERFVESLDNYNAKVTKIISELSAMEPETIEHGEFEGAIKL